MERATTADLAIRALRHAQGYFSIEEIIALEEAHRIPSGKLVTLAPGVECRAVTLWVFSCACGRSFADVEEANYHARGCPRRKGLFALAHRLCSALDTRTLAL